MDFIILKTGDPCPCCGMPIVTEDPERLLCLSLLKKLLEVDGDGKPACRTNCRAE